MLDEVEGSMRHKRKKNGEARKGKREREMGKEERIFQPRKSKKEIREERLRRQKMKEGNMIYDCQVYRMPSLPTQVYRLMSNYESLVKIF